MHRYRNTIVLCVLTALAGCSSHRFDIATSEVASLDGSTLRIIVIREIGTSSSTVGPHPQSESKIQRRITYAIEYTIPETLESDALVPTATKLSDVNSPDAPRNFTKYQTGVPDMSGLARPEERYREAIEVHGLRFDTTFAVQSNGGTMALNVPLGGSSPATIINLQTGESKASPMPVNFRAIWNHADKRLIALHDESPSDVIGMPSSITVWDYAADTKRQMELIAPTME